MAMQVGIDRLDRWRRRTTTVKNMAWKFLLAFFLFETPAMAQNLDVMKTGLGAGIVKSTSGTINCGTDCSEFYVLTLFPTSVTLVATPSAGSVFVRWLGDCAGTSTSCTVTMNSNRKVRAEFAITGGIPPLTDFTPEGIQSYLSANPSINTPSKFIAALPVEYRRNWVLMSRSESLQTGSARFPRVLLPSGNAQRVFSVGASTHSSYPGAHPNAIEYMQWDATDKNFRFHEISLTNIAAMGSVPARSRGVSIDDSKCTRCHSTQNVLNTTSLPGTTGIPVGIVKAKSKPNWDAYDSWGGMLPFNRDRIYQGSVEAAAFRKLFNPWTWRNSSSVRMVMEQLELQPPGVPSAHVISRFNGGTNDGHVMFAFDGGAVVTTEPAPTGSTSTNVTYSFNGVAGAPPGSAVTRGGQFVTLHHADTPTSDEGRGVQLFDLLGGFDGDVNPQRIADEVINHRFATGGVPIDVRAIILAISTSCVTNPDTLAPAGSAARAFFDARNGMSFASLEADTRARRQSLPLRKADIQKLNLARTGDPYLFGADNGLIAEYGATTSFGTSSSVDRLRQEIFRRLIDAGSSDSTVMGGVAVDREIYSNNNQIALFRYFLEPLGVSVDKWSMGVRGRSRTYTFADIFSTYIGTFNNVIGNNYLGHTASTTDCATLTANSIAEWARLPPANDVPKYSDIQRIFNRSCIECHGGLGYPPYGTGPVDFSENESPPLGEGRLDRSHDIAVSLTTAIPATSYLYQRITDTSEDCPGGMMPCGGPALAKTDIETIRRWIQGGRPRTVGDPHLRTVNDVHYDFQSAGEFVLLRGENFQIQTRHKPVQTEAPLPPDAHTGLSSCASLTTAVAIKAGAHRITYQPGLDGTPDPNGLQLRIDGKLLELASLPITLSSGAQVSATGAPGGIQLDLPGGTVVVVTPGWWDYYQVWYLNVETRHARATEGLIGTVAPGNWLPALPDGGLLGRIPADLHKRYLYLYDKFANAWRVNDATSLFDYAPGMSTADFTDTTWPEESPKACYVKTEKMPPLKTIPLDVANKLCGDLTVKDNFAACVQDVMTTGDAVFANTYLLSEKIDLRAQEAEKKYAQ